MMDGDSQEFDLAATDPTRVPPGREPEVSR